MALHCKKEYDAVPQHPFAGVPRKRFVTHAQRDISRISGHAKERFVSDYLESETSAFIAAMSNIHEFQFWLLGFRLTLESYYEKWNTK